jgi:hypothetical protein
MQKMPRNRNADYLCTECFSLVLDITVAPGINCLNITREKFKLFLILSTRTANQNYCRAKTFNFSASLLLCPTEEDSGMLMSSVVGNIHMCGREGERRGSSGR